MRMFEKLKHLLDNESTAAAFAGLAVIMGLSILTEVTSRALQAQQDAREALADLDTDIRLRRAELRGLHATGGRELPAQRDPATDPRPGHDDDWRRPPAGELDGPGPL